MGVNLGILSLATCSTGVVFLGDRDLNAALNLEQIGKALPEFTPVDKKTPKSLVEAGRRTEKTDRIGFSS